MSQQRCQVVVSRSARASHSRFGFGLPGLIALGLTAAVSGAQDQTPESTDAADVSPPSAVIVEGQITDSMGAGQSDVSVTVIFKGDDGSRGETIATATTDEFGDFKVTLPRPITADAFVILAKPHYAELVHEVRLDPSEPPPFIGEMLTGNLKLSGRVESHLGNKPVADARVSLEASYEHQSATTDKQGVFTLTGIAPGRGALPVEAAGFGREQVSIPQLEEPGAVVVVLKPERVVRLLTLDDLGQPVSGVTVECLDQSRNDFRTTVTDENGSAVLRGLHFDTARLLVRLTHEQYVSSRGFDRKIDTPPDKIDSTHEFVMIRAGRLEGSVTDASTNQPLYGARVMTGTGSSDDSPREWTSDQGYFEIAGVTPGEVVVTVHLSGYAPELKTANVRAGHKTRVDIALKPPTVVKGVVKFDDGKPAVGAEVVATRWRNFETLGIRAMTDREGRFAIENAPADSFDVTAFLSRSKPVVATVGENRTETLEIELMRPPEGDGLAGAVALAVGAAAPELTLTSLDGQTFTLRSLRGKIVVVDFWATWCAPCVEEMPMLAAVFEKYKGRKDFAMLGVSRDFEESDLRIFLDRRKEIAWPQVFGEKAGADSAAEKFGVVMLPALFVIDTDGKIVGSGLRGDQIAEVVQRLLPQ